MTFYFITTDHLEAGVWFRDDEDFKVGMNYIAIEAAITGVNVMAFILMSNHVHFVLECTMDEAQLFINNLKKRYSMYYGKRYGVKEFLRRNRHTVQEVDLSKESFERAVAYTVMNSVAANICLNCVQYQWGTGNVYFNPKPEKGTPISNFTCREQRRILHSTYRLPTKYLVGEDGFILPSSYVKVEFVEKVFRTPSRLNFFLQNSSKAKIRLSADENIPAFRDKTIIPSVQDLCQSLFRKTSLNELTDEQTSELLKQLRRRFNADLKQISRVTGIEYTEAAVLLSQF